MEELKINLGCGPFKIDGYVNVDSNPGVNPDVCKDVISYLVSCGSESVNKIYYGHLLEHLMPGEAIALIVWCGSVLKPGGTATFVVPDIRKGWDMYTNGRITSSEFGGIITGSDTTRPDDLHKQFYDDTLLGYHLSEFGWEVSIVPITDIKEAASHAGWQSAAICTK